MAREKNSGKQSGKADSTANAENQSESHDGAGIADFVKKMAYLSVGTMFATQETASRVIKDVKLPREAVNMLMQGVERNREEMMKIVSRTMADYLQNLDMIHLMKNAMDGMNVKVSGEVQFNYDPSKKGKMDVDIKGSAKPGRKRRRKTA